MSSRLRRMIGIGVLTLLLPAAAAADEIDAPKPQIERELQAPAIEPARTIAPESDGGWGDSPGEAAIDDWNAQNPWGYGQQSIFPLTKSVIAADLPLWAKIPAYPLAGLYDFAQLPFGAIGGLWGN
jgi:hypothetical protein